VTLAVARLGTAQQDGPVGGTAFAITSRLALTMLHCLTDVDDPERRHDEVWLHFGDVPPVRAVLADSDDQLDVALLDLADPLPDGLEPLPLTGECFPNDLWYAVGFPHAVEDDRVGGFALSGRVSGVDSRIRDDAEAIQLHCEQAAAGLPLSGASGGPVFVGRPFRVAGMIRCNIERRHEGLALGGEVFATPLAAIGRRFPKVADHLQPSTGPSPERDATTEQALLRNLPLAADPRRHYRVALVTAGVTAALLLTGAGTAIGASIMIKDIATRAQAGDTLTSATASTARPSPGNSPSETATPSLPLPTFSPHTPARSTPLPVTTPHPTTTPPSTASTPSSTPSTAPPGTRFQGRLHIDQPGFGHTVHDREQVSGTVAGETDGYQIWLFVRDQDGGWVKPQGPCTVTDTGWTCTNITFPGAAGSLDTIDVVVAPDATANGFATKTPDGFHEPAISADQTSVYVG